MLANCGHDERGRYTGGKRGDQTSTEWQVIPYYRANWDHVIRHPLAVVRERMALYAEHAAANDLIGYSQSDRLSFYEQLSMHTETGDPAEITQACNADCSSGVAAIAILTGWQLEREGKIDAETAAKLKSIPPSNSTYYEQANFTAAGFEILDDSRYLTSDAYLVRGDILLNTQVHTVINLTDGMSIEHYDSKPIELDVINGVSALTYMSWIRDIQREVTDSLSRYGQAGVVFDGINGPETEGACARLLQCGLNDAWGSGLTVDGIIGDKTLAAIAAHPVGRGYSDYGDDVYAIKCGLVIQGYDIDLTNWDWTDECDTALKQHQKYHQLVVDGICGRDTLPTLLPEAMA